jgi:hypothetical protein
MKAPVRFFNFPYARKSLLCGGSEVCEPHFEDYYERRETVTAFVSFRIRSLQQETSLTEFHGRLLLILEVQRTYLGQ